MFVILIQEIYYQESKWLGPLFFIVVYNFVYILDDKDSDDVDEDEDGDEPSINKATLRVRARNEIKDKGNRIQKSWNIKIEASRTRGFFIYCQILKVEHSLQRPLVRLWKIFSRGHPFST